VAAHFRVSPPTVRQWVRKKEVPFRRGKGRRLYFSLDEVTTALEARKFDGQPGAKAQEPSDDLKAAQLRKERALAEQHELKARRMRGELLPRADVEEIATGIVQAWKGAVENVARVQPQRHRKRAQKMAAEMVEGAVVACRAYLARLELEAEE
jgi:phage terminase Nu1 subunit (DNA packaging protein)